MKPHHIDAVASQPHYVDHLLPIWRALPAAARGIFYATNRHIEKYARAKHDLVCEVGQAYNSRLCLAAGARDLTHSLGSQTQAVFLEHGAGQQYRDWPLHPSYAGGDNRHAVVLFLALNERTAALDAWRYQRAQVVVVGSPHLDHLAHIRDGRGHDAEPAPADRTPAVAFCWHYNEGLVPETRSAFPWWRNALVELAATGRYRILGHAHPRQAHDMERWYAKHDIAWVGHFDDVVRQADVVCFDNTSAGYEAAALGIPVVALNAPWWRRDVQHGLRFWDLVPGPQANDGTAAELEKAIQVAADPWTVWEQDRQHVANQVYPPHTRGKAAQLAAHAIERLLAR